MPITYSKSQMIQMSRRFEQRRKSLGMTIEDIANKSAVNKNTCLRFLDGKGTRQDTLIKLCKALDTSPKALLNSEILQGRDYTVLRTEYNEDGTAKRTVYRTEKGLDITGLLYRLPYGSLNASIFEIHEQGNQHAHVGEELLMCLRGEVGIRICSADIKLREGDAVTFFATEPHSYYNPKQNQPDYNKATPPLALSVWTDSKNTIDDFFLG